MNTFERIKRMLFKRDGTCQVERLPPQLVATHALIDEKALGEHLIFAYLYTDLLQYYDSQNEPVAHNVWRYFLEQDDTVILSLIIHTENDKLRTLINNDFLVLRHKKTITSDSKYTKRLLSVLEDLLLLLNYWHKNLSPDNSVKLEIQNLIDYELNDRLTALYDLLQQWHHQEPSETIPKFCTFLDQMNEGHTPWELTPSAVQERWEGSTLAQDTISTLRELFDVIINGIISLQKLAYENYASTLTSQQHKPQVALLIAFLRLLHYASTNLNNVPQRHLDFYYREVLKFRRRLVKPDSVHMCFQLSNDVPYYMLPKGTLLSAGKDGEGKDIVFKTNYTVTLNQATISQVCKVHQTIQAPRNGEFFTSGKLLTATHSAADLNPSQSRPPAKAGKDPKKSTQSPSLLGLVIASPILHLKEGHRNIKLVFKFSQKSFALLQQRARAKSETPNSLQEQLTKLFSETLAIQLTTPKAWATLSLNHINVTANELAS
ncbi:MAG: hypothetical protein AAFQ78_01005, partial [Bacteroidota bacterium]